MTTDGGGAGEFDAYVAARSAALRRLATLLTGDAGHAEDAVQTALVEAWRRWDRISRLDSPDAYVRRMLVNAARAGRRRHSGEVLGARPPEPQAAERADAVVDRDPMWRALRRLPAKQRAVLVLRFYEDLTEAQTAAALGCHVGTVKRYTARALETLRADSRIVSARTEARP
ncbi:MAG TPA: SigE family RNA polymerase sigma factor [Frankiaceae bacterium]|nr:SigE family RNA polymerase sigma factor [Frankiaceae bacterium]